MIKVLHPGIYSSIQDMGRYGHANIGVPISGAMDQYAASLANRILNNSNECATLEITLGAASFEFLKATTICITGGDFSAKLNGNPVQLNAILQVKQHDVLQFGKRQYGVRTYLAVKGGFQSPKVLGSRSFYKGITAQNRLLKNDTIAYFENNEEEHELYASIRTNRTWFENNRMICFPGPEFERLTQAQKQQLGNTLFHISKDNNRMGYRLDELFPNDLPQIFTSAVLPGTVQLTPSGKIIVLMRDCQVTGGYPRVLQLSESAINSLSQKTTSDQFQFELRT